MSKKNLIMAGIIILVIIVAVAAVYYFVSQQPKIPGTAPIVGNNTITPKPVAVKLPDINQQEAQIKIDYPQVIDGVITFLDAGTVLKTTIKATDGKVYELYPAQPESVYMSFGAKNGGQVEIQGKVLDAGKLSWGAMKPI